MLQRDDIVNVEITDEMRWEAKRDADFLEKKQYASTRNIYKDKNIIGSLAHQAVEQAFDDRGMYGYHSTRTLQFQKGDEYDILYENDYIDVKGVHGILDERYFYNKQFLVLDRQLEDPKIEKITHFCFVLVHPDFTQAWIYGLITQADFLRVSLPVKLMYDNQAIKAKDLRPFYSYLYRV